MAAPLFGGLGALLAVLSFPGCDGRRVDLDDLERRTVSDRQAKRALDVLFVIDSSGSMAEEQAAIASSFASFRARLAQTEGGVPDLRVAVVSTDLGTGAWSIGGCTALGDAAQLLNRGCLDVGARWMEDREDPGCTGAPEDCRVRNFPGTPEEAFACLSALGTAGCGFEQPLEAMKRALDQNPDLLRDGAALAVIFVGDEDDCSAIGDTLFDTTPAQDSLDSPLGPLASYRCFEHGVVCDPDAPRVPGIKEGCVPREDSAYVHPVARYVELLDGLVAAGRPVIVAAITGPTDVIEVIDSVPDQRLELDRTCRSDVGYAEPAVRLHAVAEATGGVTFPICNSGTDEAAAVMTEAAATIVARLRDALDGACLDGVVHDVDADRPGVQVDCVVIEGADLAEIPACDDTGGAAPCYRVARADACADTATGLAIFVERDATPAPGTKVSASCLVRPDDAPTRSVYDCGAGGGGDGAGGGVVVVLAAGAAGRLTGGRRRRARARPAS